jgi:helicase-exonuclease AddAB, AddA subunit, Firmicutes type
MPKWTKEQQSAIDDRNKNLLVSAAAGSGKTAVLVERIIQLILRDGVNIDEMLIVTFTQAAAGEMRERISRALLGALEANDQNGEYLRSQINLLGRASISTLHAFCMDVVRRYFHVVDINPNFRVGDATETTLLKTEALEELLESEYEKGDPDFCRLVEMYGGGRDDSPLQDLIARIYEFIQSKPDPLGWLYDKADDFKLDAGDLAESSWGRTIIRQIQIELAGAEELLQEALAQTGLPGGPIAYQAALQSDLDMVDGLKTVLQESRPSFYERLQQVHPISLARAGKDVDPKLQDEVKNLRDQAKKIIKEIQTKLLFQSPEDFCRDLNELHPSIKYLYSLIQAFSERYREQKADKSIVDFNDLEHYALTILKNPEIAGEYQRHYACIFVDEYQDSNLVQETILNLIRNPDNLFLVGDVKQSIYRFRLADPSLFMEKYTAFALETGGCQRRIDLSINFRSRPAIIAGINDIFSRIMSAECGEIDYNESVYLYAGVELPVDLDEEMTGPPLELILVEKNSEGHLPAEPTDESESEDIGDVEAEARIAARRIKELSGQLFYDSKLGCCRPLEYRDMVVLMRAARQPADVFYETFMAEGIPVYADVERGYFQTLEINLFMNLLRLIDNKRQDIPLVSVMRSPIGGFSLDEMITVRASSQAPNYYEALEEYVAMYNDTLQCRLLDFINRLNSWKEESRFMNMDEFIWHLLVTTGFYHYVGAMPGGLQRQANLRILLERANQYQSTALKGLFHFIKFVDKLRTGVADMGMAKILSENENVVRIMSIHKSKGLEFPVVIVAGLGRGFNAGDTRAPVLVHKDLGLGPCYVNPELRITRDTIARIALKHRIKMENLAEEMRILYVACTRPREKLILMGSIRDLAARVKKWGKAISPFQLTRGLCHLDWIGPVVMRHPDGRILRELDSAHQAEPEECQFDYHWRVNIINRSDRSLAAPDREQETDLEQILSGHMAGGGSPEKDRIWLRLNWQYPYREAIMIPSKISVSQVKNLQSSGLESLQQTGRSMTAEPKFMQIAASGSASSALGGAAKGTIMHFVMQHLDLKRVRNEAEVDQQIKDLVSRELLREDEAQAVDSGKIMGFFRSALGQRVLKAERVHREVPFNLCYQAESIFAGWKDSGEELLLQGVIDLYFEEDEDLVLVDYKTDRVTPENREELIARYRVQILLYQNALEKLMDRKVKNSSLYLFDSGEEVAISGD